MSLDHLHPSDEIGIGRTGPGRTGGLLVGVCKLKEIKELTGVRENAVNTVNTVDWRPETDLRKRNLREVGPTEDELLTQGRVHSEGGPSEGPYEDVGKYEGVVV